MTACRNFFIELLPPVPDRNTWSATSRPRSNMPQVRVLLDALGRRETTAAAASVGARLVDLVADLARIVRSCGYQCSTVPSSAPIAARSCRTTSMLGDVLAIDDQALGGVPHAAVLRHDVVRELEQDRLVRPLAGVKRQAPAPPSRNR